MRQNRNGNRFMAFQRILDKHITLMDKEKEKIKRERREIVKGKEKIRAMLMRKGFILKED